MVQVEESAKLYTPAERIWDVVGSFAAITDWHPDVLGCETDTDGTLAVRRLDIGAGEPVAERLETQDDDTMMYSYTLVSGPLPVRDYSAALQVHANDATSCTVSWTATFEPDGADRETAVDTIRRIFRHGLDHLRFTMAG